MSSAPVEVKVIYDASSKRRKSGNTVVRTGVGHGKWLVFGLINLLLAGVLYYGTWWRVDRDILYPKLIMNTGIPELFAGPNYGTNTTAPPPPMSIDSGTIKLWSAVYGWLTLATIAYGALALSSGSLLGRYCGKPIRRAGLILTIGAVLGLGLAAYITWDKYEMAYKASHFRWYMGGVGAALLFLGLAIAGHVRGLAKTASLVLMLSALGSVVGIILLGQIDALPPEQTTTTFVGVVFVIHSFWAWILWPMASRIPK